MPATRRRHYRHIEGSSFFSAAWYTGKLMAMTTLGFAAGYCLVRNPGATLAGGAVTYFATQPSRLAKLL